jgi:hypothetical protein
VCKRRPTPIGSICATGQPAQSFRIEHCLPMAVFLCLVDTCAAGVRVGGCNRTPRTCPSDKEASIVARIHSHIAGPIQAVCLLLLATLSSVSSAQAATLEAAVDQKASFAPAPWPAAVWGCQCLVSRHSVMGSWHKGRWLYAGCTHFTCESDHDFVHSHCCAGLVQPVTMTTP